MFYEKLKNKLELSPVITVVQTIEHQFPVYHIDITSEVECDKIAKFCINQQQILGDTFTDITNRRRRRTLKNLKAWHSDYMYGDHEDPVFSKMCSLVKEKVNQIDPKYSYFIDVLWYVIFDKDDSTTLHAHDADFAAVFYPSVPKNSSPLIIMNQDQEIEIPIKTGSLVICRGPTKHLVKPCNSEYEGKRISIAINLFKEKVNKDYFRTPSYKE